MPGSEIKDLDPAAALTGAELAHVVQGGESRKISVDEIASSGHSFEGLASATIPAPVLYLRTTGYRDAGDGGHAVYKRETADPGHPLATQSVDGAWWVFAEQEVLAEQAGMIGDGLGTSSGVNATGIANAIAWISAKGGGRLRLGPGRYRLNASTVASEPGVEIIGAGRNVTFLDYVDAASTQGLQIAGNIPYFLLEGFQVQNADLVGIRIVDTGGNPNRAEIRNVAAKFNGQAGFYFEGLFLANLSGCHSDGNGGYGFNFAGYHTTINAENSQARNNTSGGWRIFNTAYSSFDACAADGNAADGWELEQVVAAFSGCGAEGNGNSGFRCVGSAGTNVSGVRASLDGCFAYNNDSLGAGGNFVDVDAVNEAVVLGLRECSDQTAPGGRSVNVVGANAITYLEGCAWAGTKSLAGAYVENQSGDLKIGKSAPALRLIDGATEMRMILSGGIGFLQGANGKFYFSDMFGQDLVELKARFGGVYRDILRSDTGILKAGDTMTGLLKLSGDPTDVLHAVPKRYADLKLALTGGTLTGNLKIDKSNGSIELGAPAAASTPFMDFHSSGNSLDYDARIIASGGTLTKGQGKLKFEAAELEALGPLTLPADPVADLEAATKRYVDLHLPLAGGALTGDLTIEKATTEGGANYRMSTDSGARQAKLVLSEAGTLYLQADATAKALIFRDDAGGDLTTFQVKVGGAEKDILHTGNGVPLTGAVMTGDLTVRDLIATGSDIRVRGPGNRHLWLQDDAGTEKAVIWHNDSDDTFRMRHKDGAGATINELTFGATADDLKLNGKNIIHAGGGQSITGRLTLDLGANDVEIFKVYGSSDTAYLALGQSNAVGYVGVATSSGTEGTLLVFRTASAGAEADRLVIDQNGHIRPGAANSQSLGSMSYPWATVVTSSYRDIDNLQVVGARVIGWAAPTGTATRTAYDTATVTTAELAERVKALLDDLTTHGLIGA